MDVCLSRSQLQRARPRGLGPEVLGARGGGQVVACRGTNIINTISTTINTIYIIINSISSISIIIIASRDRGATEVWRVLSEHAEAVHATTKRRAGFSLRIVAFVEK